MILKKSGASLLEAPDGIKSVVAELRRTKFPKNPNVTITGDMSKSARTTLADLNNTIVIGFVLVVLVLMFFMGLTNAVFVALSVPLSKALTYIVLPIIGFTINKLVMFAFIFALGIVVDDAIAVIEKAFAPSAADLDAYERNENGQQGEDHGEPRRVRRARRDENLAVPRFGKERGARDPGSGNTGEQEQDGPTSGKPINMEISGDNLKELVATASSLKEYLYALGIAGIVELKSDFDDSKPELTISVDRMRANNEGIASGTIGSEIRTAILGKEASKLRECEDQYPIRLRYDEPQRSGIDRPMSLKTAFREASSGALRQIPLSSVAKVSNETSFGGVNRKNLKRLIALSSNVLRGCTPNEIVGRIHGALGVSQKPETVGIRLTGEREDQRETMSFLGRAMLLSLCRIMFILITQFNSPSTPLIIVAEVLFGVIGVLLGFAIFGMPLSIIMTGMGIIAPVGIVVKNGILIIGFTDVLKAGRMKTRRAVVRGVKTLAKPVLLTAGTTLVGLVPPAVGFNIDFAGLFRRLQPRIRFGGENAAFFGSLAWTIIFGLSFATFITLLLIPAMYHIAHIYGLKLKRRKSRRRFTGKPPPFVPPP